MNSYNAIFSDGYFEKVDLKEIINKGGAAGRIFSVEKHVELVAKVFHSTAKSATNREKLQAMILNRPDFHPVMGAITATPDKFVQIAWPEALLENEDGFCVGYLMPLIDLSKAVSLDHVMQRAVRQKLGISEKYEHRLQIAYNLCAMVAALHQKGHYIVDLKPSNVYVYKDSRLVAILDCDSFSISGEKNRYPAEYVSEEYIYPEGMEQTCEEMGEEQDKFALAVILFKLLNNGIHPFSGTPRKSNAENLTIQERIAKNHYAYGSWADLYQAPHPYSIHDYFAKNTLEMFDRAFVKGLKRPTAAEWEEHLRSLLQNLRQCKKNPNHTYFNSRGCGLCITEEKFKVSLKEMHKQLSTPRTVRGVEIEKISPEKIARDKEKKRRKNIKINYATIGGTLIYLSFWTTLYRLLAPAAEFLNKIGLGLQFIAIIFIMTAIHKVFKKITPKIPLFAYEPLPLMLQVYAFVCIIISLIVVNDLPLDILTLAK